MPIVTKAFAISNDNSPHTANVKTGIDLAVMLSEYYGKNIRQGQTFTITGVQAWLRPADFDDGAFIDSGINAAVRLAYLPTTRHSRKAWNNVFQQWKGQKRLAGLTGSQVRYDDLEFAWSEGQVISGRTSTIYGTGIGDSDVEDLVLTGASDAGDDFCLRDYYNSAYASPPASLDHFDNSVTKQPKFGDTQFPEIQFLTLGAHNNAIQTETEIIGGVSLQTLTGAQESSHWMNLPTYCGVFCGVMLLEAFVMPDDTAAQVEEDMELVVSFAVDSWKPLVYKPKRVKAKRTKKSSKRGKHWTGYRKKKGNR